MSFAKHEVFLVAALLLVGSALLVHSRTTEALTSASAPYRLDTADPRLVLVNLEHPLSEQAEPALLVADEATGKKLEKEAAEQYRRMAQAAQQAGVQLKLCSGYRSYEYQQMLFQKRKQKYLDQGLDEQQAEEKAKTIVAYPGCSEHQTGYAADIVTPGAEALEESFAQTQAFAWLEQNAAQYGFVLRYPKGHEEHTGIVYEPWHWRYVGPENAAILVARGICLEEFWAMNTR